MVFWRIRLAAGRMACSLMRLDSALASIYPTQATARFVLEDRPHQPLCPPTSQPPQPIHFVLKTKISLTTLCVVGRFCVLYRMVRRVRNAVSCLVVSVSVISTASLDASKQLERWFVLFGRKLCMAVCAASWASARLSLAGEN